ncbi:MAG: hypothetical protein ACK4N5_12540, partial [Myxococcales bacterium]
APVASQPISAMGVREHLFLVLAMGPTSAGVLLHSLLAGRNRRAVSRFVALVSLIVCAVLLLLIHTDVSPFVARAALSVTFTVLVVAIDCLRTDTDMHMVLHAVNATFSITALYFGAMALWPLYFADPWLQVMPAAATACDMLLLCQLLNVLGYAFAPMLKKPFEAPLRRWLSGARNPLNGTFARTSDREFVLFFALLLLGSIGRVWNIVNGAFFYVDKSSVPVSAASFIAQFDRLFHVAWLYGAILTFTKRRRVDGPVGLATWTVIALEFAYQLISGSKGRFFFYVIRPLGVAFILSTRRVSRKMLAALIVAGVASWFLVYPALVSYRANLSSARPESVSHAAQMLTNVVENAEATNDKDRVATLLTPALESNFAEQVTALTSIVYFEPFQDSSELWKRLLFFWVPRFLWYEKPQALSGNLIGRLTGRLNEGNFDTSVVITGPGELYLYYGMWGALLMFLAGIVIRLGNALLAPFASGDTPLKIAIFVAYFEFLSGGMTGQFESSITGLVLQIAVLAAVLTVLNRLLFTRRRA